MINKKQFAAFFFTLQENNILARTYIIYEEE